MYPSVLRRPRKRIPIAATVLALTALTTFSRPVLADAPAATATDDAAALVRAGHRAQLAGRLDEAEASFRAAFALAPGAATAIDLALCELAAGKARAAAERLARLLRSPGGTIEDERRERAAQALADARQKVATVTVAARPALTSILIDGVPVAGSPSTEALFLSPGRHVVRGTLDGHLPAQAIVEAEAGRTYVVQIDLLPLPQIPPPPPPPEADEPAFAPSLNNLFVGPRGVVRGAGLMLAAAALTGGFASLAAAAVSESTRQAHAARLRPLGSGACAGQGHVPHDCVVVSNASEARNRASSAAGLLFAGAGACAVATLASVLFLPAPRTRSNGAHALITLAPAAGLTGGGLFLEGLW